VKISHLVIGILLTVSAPVWAQQQSTWFHTVDSDEVRSYQQAPDPGGNYQDRELKSYEQEQPVDEDAHELKSYEQERPVDEDAHELKSYEDEDN